MHRRDRSRPCCRRRGRHRAEQPLQSGRRPRRRLPGTCVQPKPFWAPSSWTCCRALRQTIRAQPVLMRLERCGRNWRGTSGPSAGWPSCAGAAAVPKTCGCVSFPPAQPPNGQIAHTFLMSAFRDFVAATGHFIACQHICSGEPSATAFLPQSLCSFSAEIIAIQPMASRMFAYSPSITAVYWLHKCLISCELCWCRYQCCRQSVCAGMSDSHMRQLRKGCRDQCCSSVSQSGGVATV